MLEIGATAVNLNRVAEKGISRETNLNIGFGFSDVLKEIQEGRLVIAGGGDSELLNFKRREHKVEAETRVPEKESENIFDVIAEIRKLVYPAV